MDQLITCCSVHNVHEASPRERERETLSKGVSKKTESKEKRTTESAAQTLAPNMGLTMLAANETSPGTLPNSQRKSVAKVFA